MRLPRVRLKVRLMMAVTAIWIISVFGCIEGFGPGVLDYSYDLSGGYQVFRSSSHEIAVVPKPGRDDGTLRSIPPKVVEIAWDDSFILAKQQALKARSPDDAYQEPVPDQFRYWILDLKGPRALGPLAEREFQAKRVELGIDPRLQLKEVGSFARR
jgi:hypothetical protein